MFADLLSIIGDGGDVINSGEAGVSADGELDPASAAVCVVQLALGSRVVYTIQHAQAQFGAKITS